MNVELTSMLWGGLSGAAMSALGLWWLWEDKKPSKFEIECIKSDIKDIRGDIHALQGMYLKAANRMDALEHPPFKFKFGDWVMAEKPDKSGMQSAIYLGSRNGVHRVVVRIGDNTSEYDTEKVEPLDD